MNRVLQIVGNLLNEPGQILACRYGADWAGKNVVEQERGNRQLSKGVPHSLSHDPVHASSHEHAAGLDVNRANGITEQHDSENEPGRALANYLFRISPRVVRRRC